MNKRAAGLKHFDTVAEVVAFIGSELPATLRDDANAQKGPQRLKRELKNKADDIEAVADDLYHLDDAEHATVLAALRFWQAKRGSFNITLNNGMQEIFDIADNGDTVEPLNDTDIDALCERLNTGG